VGVDAFFEVCEQVVEPLEEAFFAPLKECGEEVVVDFPSAFAGSEVTRRVVSMTASEEEPQGEAFFAQLKDCEGEIVADFPSAFAGSRLPKRVDLISSSQEDSVGVLGASGVLAEDNVSNGEQLSTPLHLFKELR
jgi:hypothetical protein